MPRLVNPRWRMKPRYRPSVSEDIGVDSIAARIERNLEEEQSQMTGSTPAPGIGPG